MKSHRIAVVIAALSLAACHIGANAANLHSARNPEGVTLRLYTTRGLMEGELLSMREDGALVSLLDGRVALVPWSITNEARALGLGNTYRYGSRIPPSADVKSRLTLVSHFPHGMTEQIQSRFLALKGQTQIVVLQ